MYRLLYCQEKPKEHRNLTVCHNPAVASGYVRWFQDDLDETNESVKTEDMCPPYVYLKTTYPIPDTLRLYFIHVFRVLTSRSRGSSTFFCSVCWSTSWNQCFQRSMNIEIRQSDCERERDKGGNGLVHCAIHVLRIVKFKLHRPRLIHRWLVDPDSLEVSQVQ